MADSTLVTNGEPGHESLFDARQQVWIDSNIVYYFYINDADDVVYVKSTNGGTSWDSPVTIDASTTRMMSVGVWYDKWTPGDSPGDSIHIVFMRLNSPDGVFHRELNTLTSSISARHTIVSAIPATSDIHHMSIAKSRGGNLYCTYNEIGVSVNLLGMSRSTDNGVNWTVRADPWSGEDNTVDTASIFPGNEADDQDMWLVFWDDSANELSLKTYDDSLDSFAETLISTGMNNTTSVVQMAGAIRHSDNHLLLSAHSDFTASHDLKVWDINGSGSIVAKTNIFTATIDQFATCIAIDNFTDDIYVGYYKTIVAYTQMQLVYVKSTNGGTSWGSEVVVNTSNLQYRGLYSDIGSSVIGKFQPIFQDSNTEDSHNNTSTGVVIGGTGDIRIMFDGIDGVEQMHDWRQQVITSINDIYFFYIRQDNRVVYKKSTDGGSTWSLATVIAFALTRMVAVSVWYEKWTPSATGELIHIAYIKNFSDGVFHLSLDTSDDSISSQHTILSGSTAAGNSQGNISIAKSRGGNLYCAHSDLTPSGALVGMSRSVDNGVTWTARADPWSGEEAQNDKIQIFPGNEADDQDMWAIFLDSSVDELSLKTYDDSLDSFAETLISTGIPEDDFFGAKSFNGAIRHSDNHLILAAHTENDAAHDLKVWDINGSGSIVAKTSIFISDAANFGVVIAIDTSNDDIYAAYFNTIIAFSTAEIVYKKSTDGATTWGSAIKINISNLQYRAMYADQGSVTKTKWMPIFFDNSLEDAFTNPVTEVLIGGGMPTFLHYLVLVPGP